MTYEHTQVELVVRPEKIIEKSITECMSTKRDEFVRSILDGIAEGREVSRSNDATVLHQSIHNHVPGHLSAVKFIRDNPSHECNSLLADFCDSLTSLAGDIFPKRASELTSSELTFLIKGCSYRPCDKDLQQGIELQGK